MIRTGQQEEKKKKKKQYIYIALFFAQSYQKILRQEPTCMRENERERKMTIVSDFMREEK